MKTFDINEIYDYQFQDGIMPDGDDYSNLFGIGAFKNLFPKHTFVGKILGSTREGHGIIFHRKKKTSKKENKPVTTQSFNAQQTPLTPEKKDNTKKYMMIGGAVLLLIIIIILVMRKK